MSAPLAGVGRQALASLALGALLAVGGLSSCGGGDDSADRPAAAFYGVQPQTNPDAEDYSRMVDAGVGTYRVFISWRAHDRTEGGSYDFSALDNVFVNLAFSGIEPLPYVAGVPEWASEDPHTDPLATAAERRALARFMRALAKRYGPGGALWSQLADSKLDVEPVPVRTWEIWNEQNSAFYWQPSPSVEQYGRLVELSAEAIRSVDPEARIMTGGMFGTPPEPESIDAWTFIGELLADPAVRDEVDVVGVHPYSQTMDGVAAQLERMREAIDEAGAVGMPMYVSEIGWGSDDGGGFKKGRDGQAEMLTDTFELARERRKGLGIEGIVWFTWRDGLFDDGTFNSSSGLLEADGEAKPSLTSYAEQTGAE